MVEAWCLAGGPLIDAIAAALRAERAAAWKEALKRAASIVENVPHSCVSDEHCCALHEAHKRAAAEIRALAARGRRRDGPA